MSSNNKILSIVIPFFNEEQSVHELLLRLDAVVLKMAATIAVELILVDDHSSDKTPVMLKAFCQTKPYSKYLRLSKNSGSHIAIISGMSICSGDCAVFLASDLQDPPELIEKMLQFWNDGADVVWAVRKSVEGISISTSFFSKLFYRLVNSSSSVKLPPTGADFALLDRKVIKGLVASAGSNPSLGSLIAWLGFEQAQIDYVKEARKYGKSKWTLTKKLNAFVDAFVGFSFVPMRIMMYFGFTMATIGFIYAMVVICLRVISGQQIEGWASLMVVLLIIGGILMIMLGVLGEYLWRSLEESRKRPLFFIEDSYGDINLK
ncbi:MAG: glycosyltransferase family 2 protein [Ferruginibacter sp.]